MTVAHERPIVITMGDPSGVGAEVTVKALAALPPSQRADFAIIGDRRTVERAIAASGLDLGIADATPTDGNVLRLIDVPTEGLPDRFGTLSPRCGEAAYQFI